jgi:drug/metabolite transporter (DMT)-like permease
VFTIPREAQSTLFWRVFTGVAADLLMFYAFEFTNYSKGFCLFQCGSAFVPFIAYFILKDKILCIDMTGIAFGIVGMLFLVQPWKSDSVQN